MRKWICLIQIVLAVALVRRYPAMSVLLLLLIANAAATLLFGLTRKGIAGMAVILLFMVCMLLLPKEAVIAANIFVCISTLILLIEWLQQWNAAIFCRRNLLTAGGIFLVVFLLAAILPYVKQPEVQKDTMENFDLADYTGTRQEGERAKIISDNGEALEERIRLISQAKEEIMLSTFEFDADTSGKQVLAALIDAADRGVKVKILVDGFPYLKTMWGNPYFLAAVQHEHMEIRVYNPVRLWKPWTLMGRLHDKYLLVDDTAYLLGGRNTFDFFLGDQKGYKNYDWDVFVSCKESENPSIIQVQNYFQSIWTQSDSRSYGSSFWKWNPSVKKAGKELKQLKSQIEKTHADWFEEEDIYEKTVPIQNVRLIANPVHANVKEPTAFYEMAELMKSAESEVTFHTPYLICDDWMLQKLKEVCSDGRQVQMMTNSVVNNGNPFGAMDYHRYKGEILETGVSILEYDKGVSYHGKCFTVDDHISGIGSFNWDMRSAYLDTELMLVIDSQELTMQLRKEMSSYEADALRVTGKDSYDLPEGVTPRPMSKKKEFRIKALNLLGGWARFLM